ncbi:unnamed protein product [Pleuronectes platessa]|uniref:Uncharacterized protein n=1 Tax=Pleuronectes platessa TaxID=8262 RepID=A0A9N7VEF3_PLEPL|nr:unnamed protein product [Pleuronectes platessa]
MTNRDTGNENEAPHVSSLLPPHSALFESPWSQICKVISAVTRVKDASRLIVWSVKCSHFSPLDGGILHPYCSGSLPTHSFKHVIQPSSHSANERKHLCQQRRLLSRLLNVFGPEGLWTIEVTPSRAA